MVSNLKLRLKSKSIKVDVFNASSPVLMMVISFPSRLISDIVVNFVNPGGTSVKEFKLKTSLPIGVVGGMFAIKVCIRLFPRYLLTQLMSTVPGYCVESAHVQVSSKVDEGQRHVAAVMLVNGVPSTHFALAKYRM